MYACLIPDILFSMCPSVCVSSSVCVCVCVFLALPLFTLIIHDVTRNGHVPAQLLSIFYGAVQFGTYEHLNTVVPQFESRYIPRNFFIGGAAGLLATTVV